MAEEKLRRLVVRNTPSGMIWQIYHIKNDTEAKMLCKTASKNGFLSVTIEDEIPEGDEETWPLWRETKGWEDYLSDVEKGIVTDLDNYMPKVR